MKKQIAYWALYDFANSIVLITFLFYFSQWLVIDEGQPAWWYNGSLIASSVLFIVVAPFVSRRIDRGARKIVGLRFWTAVSLALFAGVAFIALSTTTLDVLATFLFTLATTAYFMCFLYFTPMLNDLSDDSNRGRVSGIGQGANFLGEVAGLLCTLPFASGVIALFGGSERAETMLPAVILAGLFSLPMLFFYRDRVTRASEEMKHSPGSSFISSIRATLLYKPLALLLLAYFLFGDALLTFGNNFPLYLETLYGTDDTTKALLTIVILTLSAVGGVVFGFVTDRVGHKKTLIWILGFWVLLFGAASFVTNFNIIVPLFLIGGLFFGPVWGITRAMVGRFAPPNLTASSYMYYVVAERFATLVGPLAWSGALLAFGEGAPGYQAAIFSMGILIVAGLFVMSKVPETPP